MALVHPHPLYLSPIICISSITAILYSLNKLAVSIVQLVSLDSTTIFYCPVIKLHGFNLCWICQAKSLSGAMYILFIVSLFYFYSSRAVTADLVFPEFVGPWWIINFRLILLASGYHLWGVLKSVSLDNYLDITTFH